MEGLERLEKEVLEMENSSISLIFDYLKERKDLSEKFNNEEKSIKGMYDYICDKARKMAKNNVAMVQDNLVYIWAVTYFTKTNEELGIKKKNVMPPSADKVIKKTAKKKSEKEKEKTKESKENPKEENQITIFKKEEEK